MRIPCTLRSLAMLALGMLALGMLAGCNRADPGWDGPDQGEPLVIDGCPYHGGPYGVGNGQTIAPYVGWEGKVPGLGAKSSLAVQDLLDCDGSRGIDVVVFHTAAEWCGPCELEARALDELLPSWSAMGYGVRLVILMVQALDGSPATTEQAMGWGVELGLHHSYVMADPPGSLMKSNAMAFPQVTVVDPRTMRIEAVFLGAGEADEMIVEVAERNAELGP